MSETVETLKDLVHLAGVALNSGYHMPSEIELDRYSFEKYIERRERYKVNQNLKRLNEQKLLSIKKRGDKIVMSITDKGKHKLIKIEILQNAQFCKKGYVTLVSFDIPEEAKDVRNSIRRFLKEADFEQVHRSVWRSKYNVAKELEQFIKCINAEKWVRVYLAKEIR